MKIANFQIIILFFLILFCVQNSNAQYMLLELDDSTGLPNIQLGEIHINASKDNLKINEIPASVSLINSGMIENNEIHSLAGISAITPNFYMPDYGSKLTSPVYIRGIGSRIGAPSIGLYVDNVAYFEKASFDFDFFDVSRIEVLRGPQGTLFGRNTMGGVISIFTLSPFDYQGLKLKFSAGTYGEYRVNAGYYGKIREKIGYSISANYNHNDGFFNNSYTSEKVDIMDSYGIRGKLIWKVSDRFSAENTISFENSKQGGYPYALYNDSLRAAEEINYNQYSSYDRKLISDALSLKYKARKFEIIATTAYQYLDDYQEIDQDFTPDSLYFVAQKQKQQMISQEVIVRSNQDQRYVWLFGTYGFLQSFDKNVDVDVYGMNMKLFKKYNNSNAGYAFFHQSVMNDLLVENLSLTAGIRVDFEENTLNYIYDTERNDVLKNVADTVYPTLSYSAVSPKIALNYLHRRSNYYITLTRGFKTGGFNSTFERPEDLTFGPEYSWNYEAGIKTPLFKTSAYLTFAAFFIDWENQQIYQTVPSGRGSMLKNAGRSSSLGFELTLKTKSFAGFEPMLSYGYTHATFQEYVQDSLTEYSGNFIPYVPRQTASVQVIKTFNLNEKLWLDRILLHLNYQGAGKIYWNEENSHEQAYYGLFSAKVSFVHNLMKMEIWGKNLLNNEYEAFYFEALNNKYVQSGKPMQLGVSISVNL